jgi:polysaccharide biosynthesis protein PslH
VKILVLASRFPYPLEKGDKLRLFHQIRELSYAHDIVLCALHEHTVQDADFQEVKQYCSAIYLFPFSKILNILPQILRGGMPFTVAYFFNQNIQKKINQVIEKEQPDHIYCQLVRMAEYAKNAHIPKTMDYMDAFSLGQKRRADSAFFMLKPFMQYEAKLLRQYEEKVFADFDNVTIISEQDKVYLDFDNSRNIEIVTNGVDIQYFTPDFKANNIDRKYDIAFVGNLGYYPNVQAALYIAHRLLPLLKKQIPHIKILMAGARPTPDVLALKNEHIEVQAWLPDIRDAYAHARILVAPIFHGSGQQNKILEAMAMGVPCVTTSLVNNAIGAKPETEILCADTEGVFISQILKILQNIDIQDAIKMNARKFVEKNYSWASAVNSLNEILKLQGNSH